MSRRAEKLVRRWGDPVRLITEAELLYPETAVAIAILETGGFRSRWMMRNHNWFGFRPSGRRYRSGQANGYATYATAQAMLQDYQAWEWEVCMKYKLNSEAAFRRWITQHYAEDPNYGTKLAAHLREVRKTWQ